MDRLARSHGRTGVNAPSWLTFEVHRPYFDGEQTPLTAIQARGSVLAARLFERREPEAPRFGMTMPASFRTLLTTESGLAGYRCAVPTDLPAELASPAWQRLADAFAHRDDLDTVDRTGLAQWLVAVCLPDAVLALAPTDAQPAACAEPTTALLQYARANALFQRDGLTAQARAAYTALVDAPAPTVARLQASMSWAYLLARHAGDDAEAPRYAAAARELHELLAPELPAVHAAIWRARLDLREVTHAERHGDLDRAAALVASVSATASAITPSTPDDELLCLELRRRLIDRTIEVAVRRGDEAAESAALADGLRLDPSCVKIQMQAAQAAQRRGDLDAALAGYLWASRLGPYGTAFALLQAARCARQLGHGEFGRVLNERAFRAAPRSKQTHAALREQCDEPLAGVVDRAFRATGHRNNWHYQMYGAYFDLGESHSPCLYARLPSLAYEFASTGDWPRLDLQRIMPPAFRPNLVRESGLLEFAGDHPAQVPPALRPPQWQQLCDWVADFDSSDLERQFLTCLVLFRLGYRKLFLELVPPRPVSSLSTPLEFYHYRRRDLAQYAASIGTGMITPQATFDMVDQPGCPLHIRLAVATFGVVFAARETKSLPAATRWRERGTEFLADVLAADDFTDFEKVMLESRFYRGVSFVPFMRRDRAQVVEDMDRAEALARQVPATTPWQQFLKVENLHACLESRSKEAFGLGEVALGARRTEEFLALDPYDPKSHIEMAEALVKQERYGAAADSYLRTARLGPIGTAIGYCMAGEGYARTGQPVLAEDCFVQALRLDPYAVSAARGWRQAAATGPAAALATEYAGQLEDWGAQRMAARAG